MLEYVANMGALGCAARIASQVLQFAHQDAQSSVKAHHEAQACRARRVASDTRRHR